MRSATKGIRIWGFACLVLAAAAPVFSQSTTGRILGEVRDQSGAALAGASVTATHVQRATKRTVAADEAGAHVVSNLTPRVYTVRAEATGFQTVERPNATVEVATALRID